MKAFLLLGLLSRVSSRILAPTLNIRGGAAEREELTTGKVWTLKTFVRDHVTFTSQLPGYLGAYIGNRAVEPSINEAVMLTMNSINTCPYCTGLHGQLARMASAEDPSKSKAPEVIYARVFATHAGRGKAVEAAYAKLAAAVGDGKASSTRALCWFLLWGKTTGNTVNAVRGKILSLKLLSLTPFDVAVFAVYAPLFATIGVLNVGLLKMPKVPPKVSAAIGATLWVPQALHVGLLGLLSLLPAKLLVR